ncbi:MULTISPECIES: hypothetical protein [unclassified Microbacterium]|uniref:hypothetical protein n=1 Tax=unclassified Microbacterium TaxID=2609290 RepID=UPI003865D70C
MVLHSSSPKARKEHRCSTCGRVIGVGETYLRQHNVFDGQRYSYLNCEHCLAFTRRALQLDANYWDDGINKEALDEAFVYYRQNISDLRLLVMFRRRWRRSDGTLYPVPTSVGTEMLHR